jgi:hypothetical protein
MLRQLPIWGSSTLDFDLDNRAHDSYRRDRSTPLRYSLGLPFCWAHNPYATSLVGRTRRGNLILKDGSDCRSQGWENGTGLTLASA